MNKFFDDEAKKRVMAESLSSYLEPGAEGLFYPATRKIYSPEGQMIFLANENTANSPVFIRDGLCEALTEKTRKDMIYPNIWQKMEIVNSFAGFYLRKHPLLVGYSALLHQVHSTVQRKSRDSVQCKIL